MGQPGPFRTAPFSTRWAVAAMLVVAFAIACLALSAGGANGFPDQRDDGWWSTLELDVPKDSNTVEVVGDVATFKAYTHWGGSLADDAVILSIHPMPEGWTYSVSGGGATSRGFLVPEEGTVEVTIEVDGDTGPGLYYMEPRLEHPREAITLVSAPLMVQVTAYSVSLEAVYLPPGPAYPGTRIEAEIEVSADALVDRVVAVRPTWAPNGWKVGFHPALAFISQGTASSLALTITVDDRALPGEYVVILATDTSDPRASEDTWEIPIEVGITRGLRISEDPPVLRPGFGTWDSATVAVQNLGNVPAQVIALTRLPEKQLPEGWTVATEGLPVTIPPFGQAEFVARLSLPSDPVGSPAGATSVVLMMGTGRPTEDLEMTFVVHVPEVRALELSPLLEASRTGGPLNESFEYTSVLVLRDGGNLKGVRKVDLASSFDLPVLSAELSQTSVLLTSGMETQVRLTVLIHHASYPGQYPVTVTATDAEGMGAQIELDFTVSGARIVLVEDLMVEPLGILEESVYASSEELGLYRVTGKVYNGEDTTLDYAEVVLYDSSSDTDSDYLGSVPIEHVSPGGTGSFSFTYSVVRAGTQTLEVRLVVPGKALEDPEAARLEESFQAVPSKTPEPEGMPMAFVMGVAIGALAGVLSILLTEAGRFALMVFVVVPLYTRLKPEQVTDHFVRGQILGYVKANPGETYTHIRKALGISNGQFVYHARILESQGLLRSIKDGANRRFYPAGMRIPPEVKDVELNQVQRIIYTIILEYPGISQSRIARMMKLAPSTVNYHVNIMTKVGVVERKRSGRLSLCFVVDDIL